MKLMLNVVIEVKDDMSILEAQRRVNMAENYIYNMDAVEDVAAGISSIRWKEFEGSPETIARIKAMTPLPLRG